MDPRPRSNLHTISQCAKREPVHGVQFKAVIPIRARNELARRSARIPNPRRQRNYVESGGSFGVQYYMCSRTQ